MLVSMAAGVTIEALQDMAGGRYPVVRIMPNTACAVGAGMTTTPAQPRSRTGSGRRCWTPWPPQDSWRRLRKG